MRQCPVSIAELTRAGRVTELPGIGKTIEEKIKALLDTGTIPSAEKLKAKFPPTLVEVTLIPGLGAKTVRRLYDETRGRAHRRPARSGRRAADPRHEGPRARRRRRTSPLSSRSSVPRGRPSASFSPTSCRSPRSSRPRSCASTRRREAVDVAGSARRLAETCKDVDLIATAKDPKALATRWSSIRSPPRRATRGQGGAQDHDPERRLGRPADRRRRRRTGTSSSTSPARRPTTSSCASAP